MYMVPAEVCTFAGDHSSKRALQETQLAALALALTGCAFPQAGQMTISVSSAGVNGIGILGAGAGVELPPDFPLRVKDALHPGHVTFRGLSCEVIGILLLHLGQSLKS